MKKPVHKFKLYSIFIFFILFICLFPLDCKNFFLREKPLIWFTGSTIKIQPDMDPKPLFNNKIIIKAAHLEHEQFQIVVSSGKNSLSNVTIEVSKLKLTTDPDIVFPKSNIKLYFEHLIKVTKLDSDRFGSTGYYPDPLVPFDSKITVPPGENRAVLVDFDVSQTQKSGVYIGEIVVKEGKKLLKKMPIELNVLDFSLPPISETNHYNIVGVDFREIKKAFSKLNETQLEHLLAGYYELLWNHRFMPEKIDLIKPERNDMTGEVVFGEKQKKWGDYFFNKLGFFCTSIIVWEDSFEKLGLYSQKYNNAMSNLMAGWADSFEKFGWSENHKNKFLLLEYLHDETTKGIDKAYQNILISKSKSPAASRLIKKFCTIPINKKLYSMVDIWCPRIHEINSQLVQESQENGDMVWSYVSGYPLYPDGPNGIHITHPSVDNRIIYWFNYINKLSGFLYWESVLWSWNSNDPWETANTFWTNGNGVLMYPGTSKRVKNLAPISISSLRLETLREGVEDYEYFRLAEKKIGRQKVIKLIKTIARNINDYEGMKSYDEPVNLYKVRDKLIEIILGN